MEDWSPITTLKRMGEGIISGKRQRRPSSSLDFALTYVHYHSALQLAISCFFSRRRGRQPEHCGLRIAPGGLQRRILNTCARYNSAGTVLLNHSSCSRALVWQNQRPLRRKNYTKSESNVRKRFDSFPDHVSSLS